MNFYTEIMAKERASIYQSTGKACSELSATPHIPWKPAIRNPLPPIPKNEERALPQMRRVFKMGQIDQALEYINSQPADWLFTARQIESLGYYQGICTRLVERGAIEIVARKQKGNKTVKYRRTKCQ